ncbi:TVP38/TMEM64 family protein [Aliihoeflea sp. 40Bstr573]|nr:TVP38/TMEM64 family protein [Aliihoeflea sp. 40Bstr573]
MLSMADIHAVRGWVESAGAWAPAISMLIMVFQAVLAPLPAVIVTFANAAIFGWAWGAVISWTGAMLGAAICYWLAVGLGRSLVERYAPASIVENLDRASVRYGVWAVFLARLMPFISFDAVSYAAGLLRVRFWPFLLATGLGQLPATIVYSMAGDFLAVDRGMLLGGILFMLLVGALTIPLKAWHSRRRFA